MTSLLKAVVEVVVYIIFGAALAGVILLAVGFISWNFSYYNPWFVVRIGAALGFVIGFIRAWWIVRLNK